MTKSPVEITKAFDDRTRESAFRRASGKTKLEWIAEHQKTTMSTLSAARKAWRKEADKALMEENRERAAYEMQSGAALVAMGGHSARSPSDQPI